MNSLPAVLRCVAVALHDTAAPAFAAEIGRRAAATAGAAIPPALAETDGQRRQTQGLLALIEAERRTGAVKTALLASDEPWSQPRVTQVVQGAMSAPVFLQLAAGLAGPVTAGILPLCVNAIADEIASRERVSFERWLFEQEAALQERLAREESALRIELARYQRETAMQSVEAGKLFDNWPLTLVPSQILSTVPTTGPPPVRVFLSPPALQADRYGLGSGLSGIEGPLTDGLRAFLGSGYPRRGDHPADCLPVWDSKRFHGEASIRALFSMLRSEPAVVLECDASSGALSLRLAAWGLGQEAPIELTLLSRLPYEEILVAQAKDRAELWRATRDQLAVLGYTPEQIEQRGGDRAFNLRQLDEEATLAGSGVDVRDLTWQYRYGEEEVDALATTLTHCHCLVAAWALDIHFLIHHDVPPCLPELLQGMDGVLRDPEVLDALVAGYETVYAALGRHRSAWLPGALLDLAVRLLWVSDPPFARRLGEQAVAAWLAARGGTRGGVDVVEALRPLVTGEDRSFVDELARLYETLTEPERAAGVRTLGATIDIREREAALARARLAVKGATLLCTVKGPGATPRCSRVRDHP